MELAPHRAHVELRGDDVVFAFPYRADLVDAMRAMPGRRFDWAEKEWLVPREDEVAPYVRDVLDRWPDLTAHEAVLAWLGEAPSGWIARVTSRRHAGAPAFVARVRAGEPPAALAAEAVGLGEDRTLLLPFTAAVAEALLQETGARLDAGAAGCAQRLVVGLAPPPARLVVEHSVAEARFGLEVLWERDAVGAFDALPGADTRGHALPIDAWALEPLEAFLRTWRVEVDAAARPHLERLRAEHDAGVAAIRRSRARSGEPPDPPPRLGGELAPFQWAGVAYVLAARRTFLADEQGLGKTVQALAALESDGAWPAVVVCPASLKLNWAREAERWLPHRSRTVVSGRSGAPADADLTIVNYEIVADHTRALLRRGPRALVLDESHWVKNPRAKRTRAVRRLSAALDPEALRVALTGTPVMNRPDELVPQLRIIGRLEEFGSGARFTRRFRGADVEERLHWHLRRTCFVRRLKRDVLPQLPAKRQVVVPMALTNEPEYRLAERDVVAWLRQQPFERLEQLDAKVAAALRAERLAQLSALKRLAARGKLAAAVAWVHDFLESGEPLVLFSHHAEVQEALLERFPGALHLLGRDPLPARDAAVRAFQEGTHDGPPLLVASTLVAGQGITLTRASNVAFLELEWTPALHDQAEDRLHRIGQRDAVTAWYLLAAGTVDEAIAELLERKRGLVSAVTEGRRDAPDAGLVEGVAQVLREGPRRHLRPVA